LTGDVHEGSLSLKITYGEVAFIFTGDSEKKKEAEMIKSGLDLSGQIFQAGHHGSSTSNTKAFLDIVKPEVVIYSAGVDNSYGHPHSEVIERLKDMKITVYGTDDYGTIKVITDGLTYKVEREKIKTIKVDEVTKDQFVAVKPKVAPEPDSIVVGSSCSKGQVNINTAGKEEMIKIKHIDDKRGNDLIKLRPFKSLDDFKRISGIADARIKDIKAEGIACID
jgi:competence protein ComEC